MSRQPSFDETPTYDALRTAIDNEYKTRACYRAVTAAFGRVRPFADMVDSEQRHILTLLRQFRRLGWQPPADRWEGQIAPPMSLMDAFRNGLQAEIDNITLYDRLSAMTSDPQVLDVFANLRSAFAERHLPAFHRGLHGDRAPYPPAATRSRAGISRSNTL